MQVTLIEDIKYKGIQNTINKMRGESFNMRINKKAEKVSSGKNRVNMTRGHYAKMKMIYNAKMR